MPSSDRSRRWGKGADAERDMAHAPVVEKRPSQGSGCDSRAGAAAAVVEGESGTVVGNVRRPKNDTSLPVLSPAKTAQITVPFAEIEGGRLNRVLEEYGCAIVSGVAAPDECARLEGLFAADLADLVDTDAARRAGGNVAHAADKALEDVRAWPLESLSLLGKIDRCQLRGLPHGRFAWGCRLLTNLRRCYEVIHDTPDLVSSCDNPFFAPDAYAEAAQNRSWPHVDHNCHDNRFFDAQGCVVGRWEVFQGLLYVWSSEGTHASTTVVLPGSHRTLYDALMQDPTMVARGRKGDHFTQLSKASNSGLVSSLQDQWWADAARVPVPRGGLFLWSSKTMHQGWSGGPRLAQPVCWEPVGRRDESALDRKLRLAALGLPSTHWASLGIPHTLVAPEPSAPSEAWQQGGRIWLPARACIHPASLREGFSVAEMFRTLAGCSWDARLPADLRKLLEECLVDEVRAAL